MLSDVGNPYLYDEERDRDGEHRVGEGLYPPGVIFLTAVYGNRCFLLDLYPQFVPAATSDATPRHHRASATGESARF